MEERKKILEMLSNGKINVDEAERLMTALGSAGSDSATGQKKDCKFLRVEVLSEKEGAPETVNIRVPFNLLRAGVKLASLMPQNVRGKIEAGLGEKGMDVDLSKVKPEDLENLVEHLADLQVDVNGGNEKVRIYVE